MSLTLALVQLDSLIAGLEAGCELSIHPSELKMLKSLIQSAQKDTEAVEMIVGHITHITEDFKVVRTPITAQQFYKDPDEVTKGCSMWCGNSECGATHCMKEDATSTKAVLRPVAMPLFPTMNSLQSVVDWGNSQLPINTPNALLSVLSVYHNTLLQEVTRSKQYQD